MCQFRIPWPRPFLATPIFLVSRTLYIMVKLKATKFLTIVGTQGIIFYVFGPNKLIAILHFNYKLGPHVKYDFLAILGLFGPRAKVKIEKLSF